MSGVRQLAHAAAILAAIEAGERPNLVLVQNPSDDPTLLRLIAVCETHGIALRRESENDLRRMSQTSPPAQALALLGRNPAASLEAALALNGAFWLLSGMTYPGNVGFALRCAEVSGADAVAVDASFAPQERDQALRFSMRANRFMPVFWEESLHVVELARRAGRFVVALEDVGACAPWEVDLTQPVLCVVGGERHGVMQEILKQSDAIVRIPMAGFIPSYNLQAAVTTLAIERLRQLALRTTQSAR